MLRKKINPFLYHITLIKSTYITLRMRYPLVGNLPLFQSDVPSNPGQELGSIRCTTLVVLGQSHSFRPVVDALRHGLEPRKQFLIVDLLQIGGHAHLGAIVRIGHPIEGLKVSEVGIDRLGRESWKDGN